MTQDTPAKYYNTTDEHTIKISVQPFDERSIQVNDELYCYQGSIRGETRR